MVPPIQGRYTPSPGQGRYTPPPMRTDRLMPVKTEPSRRATYAGGKNIVDRTTDDNVFSQTEKP